MLNSKQKKYLKSLGQTTPSLFQVGKFGVTASLIHTVSNALNTHELIKLNLLKTCPSDVNEVADELARGTASEVVQTVGKTLLLYKENKDPEKRKIFFE